MIDWFFNEEINNSIINTNTDEAYYIDDSINLSPFYNEGSLEGSIGTSPTRDEIIWYDKELELMDSWEMSDDLEMHHEIFSSNNGVFALAKKQGDDENYKIKDEYIYYLDYQTLVVVFK